MDGVRAHAELAGDHAERSTASDGSDHGPTAGGLTVSLVMVHLSRGRRFPSSLPAERSGCSVTQVFGMLCHLPCDGKNQLTTTYRWFLATWAKRLSWSEVAAIFRTSWDSAFRAVGHAVAWGLAHRDLSGLTAMGVDEIAWSRGHEYLMLVYDIGGDARRLLAVAEERTEASRRSGLEGLGEATCKQVHYVCSDMWKPYLNVIAERLGQAVHVLDRFHVMQKFGKALDEIRAEEVKRLRRDGYEGCDRA